MNIVELAQRAKRASINCAALDDRSRNQALSAIAEGLRQNSSAVTESNAKDIAQAQRDGLSPALLKRLKFDEAKISEACAGIESLIKLGDPVGRTLEARELDVGLELYKVSCPIGVIGVIFESRPDALVQVSSLCLKSGNAVLLKGGSEAVGTNRVLAQIISQTTESSGIPAGWLGLLETRSDVNEMLGLDDCIDLIIPRGSNEFVKYIMEHTNIAVLGHADGICHVYIDGEADFNMALNIAVDSKCQYVAVCNAAETLLVDEVVARELLPQLKAKLEEQRVEIRGCEKTVSIIDVQDAIEDDWKTEYLDLIVSIKVVAGIDEAIEHINTYGSGHTDVLPRSILGRQGRGFPFRVDTDGYRR